MSQKSSTLFKPPMPQLTDRQQLAWRLTAGEGATDEQVGVALHVVAEKSCTCSTWGLCPWAAGDGRDVLAALRKKGLLIRRKTGLWQHRDCGPCELCAQVAGGPGDLPDDF